eukprot:1028713-Pelagomonas_calceolata.AAC.2
MPALYTALIHSLWARQMTLKRENGLKITLLPHPHEDNLVVYTPPCHPTSKLLHDSKFTHHIMAHHIQHCPICNSLSFLPIQNKQQSDPTCISHMHVPLARAIPWIERSARESADACITRPEIGMWSAGASVMLCKFLHAWACPAQCLIDDFFFLTSEAQSERDAHDFKTR